MHGRSEWRAERHCEQQRRTTWWMVVKVSSSANVQMTALQPRLTSDCEDAPKKQSLTLNQLNVNRHCCQPSVQICLPCRFLCCRHFPGQWMRWYKDKDSRGPHWAYRCMARLVNQLACLLVLKPFWRDKRLATPTCEAKHVCTVGFAWTLVAKVLLVIAIRSITQAHSTMSNSQCEARVCGDCLLLAGWLVTGFSHD